MKNGYSVLIVDDEEDLRDMMTYQFKARGFEVYTACDGIEGLEKLKKVNPSLIILDINMPRMGGVEMYEKICDAEGKPSHPVLVLTARANVEELFKKLSIDGFISKPFEVDNLVAQVERIVGKYARTSTVNTPLMLQRLESVYIINDNAAEANAMAVALLNAGYRVAVASSGLTALDLLASAPPQLALVKMNLMDVSGDELVLRALHSPKTSNIKFVLFADQNTSVMGIVRQRLSQKTGILGIIDYTDTRTLVEEVDQIISKGWLSRKDENESLQKHYLKFVKTPYSKPQ
jgi:DNA-binding response OmpR family regulator